MTDWLTPDEREGIESVLEQTIPNKATAIIGTLLAHAAEADRRLAERDDVIRELAEVLRDVLTDGVLCDCWRCTSSAYGRCGYGGRAYDKANAALARVDALGGERLAGLPSINRKDAK